jgi:hypothetical protein
MPDPVPPGCMGMRTWSGSVALAAHWPPTAAEARPASAPPATIAYVSPPNPTTTTTVQARRLHSSVRRQPAERVEFANWHTLDTYKAPACDGASSCPLHVDHPPNGAKVRRTPLSLSHPHNPCSRVVGGAS